MPRIQQKYSNYTTISLRLNEVIMKLQQKGFAHLELIIVLVVVVIIGAAGWFVYSNNKIDNSAGTIVPGTLPPKPDPVKPTTSSLNIDELGIKMQLKDGWTSAKTADLYGLNYMITGPASPIAPIDRMG